MQNQLGAKLRVARTARGYSLRAVAAAIGISPSLLSQVETGKTQPSVSTLYAVATHLDASMDELLGPALTPAAAAAVAISPIQRRGDNLMTVMENGVTWERLATGGSDLVAPVLTTYQPGGGSSPAGRLMRHRGVEYGYVLEGELTLRLERDSFVLHDGDSISFDSWRPHLFINHTTAVTRFLSHVVCGNAPGTLAGGRFPRRGMPAS